MPAYDGGLCIGQLLMMWSAVCSGDTDVLVIIISYYRSKGMFSDCKAYMNHCSKTTHRQRFIPVNEIASIIGNVVSLG